MCFTCSYEVEATVWILRPSFLLYSNPLSGVVPCFRRVWAGRKVPNLGENSSSQCSGTLPAARSFIISDGLLLRASSQRHWKLYRPRTCCNPSGLKMGKDCRAWKGQAGTRKEDTFPLFHEVLALGPTAFGWRGQGERGTGKPGKGLFRWAKNDLVHRLWGAHARVTGNKVRSRSRSTYLRGEDRRVCVT